VREIRMLRAMWRALETGLRNLLTGHEGGNAGNRQGASFGSPRQCSTLPGSFLTFARVPVTVPFTDLTIFFSSPFFSLPQRLL
jgi:hypothetical protein